MDNYKGFFYAKNKEQKYFEGGAHFKNKDLYEILSFLSGISSEKDNNASFNLKENNKLEYKDNNLNINKKKIKIKTRNFNLKNYANNPNTQNTQIIINDHNILNLINIKSRNYPQNFYLDETNKNYNRTNTSIFNNYKKDNIRDNLIKIFIQKRNIQKNEKKLIINII